jgi:hypothetical protein
MSDHEPPTEEDLEGASMQDARSSDSNDSFGTYYASAEEPKIYYDGGRRLGTRRELVDNWMSWIFKDPERICILEKEVHRSRGKNDSDTPSRQRKGILARRTTPSRRTVSLEAALTANTDAMIGKYQPFHVHINPLTVLCPKP